MEAFGVVSVVLSSTWFNASDVQIGEHTMTSSRALQISRLCGHATTASFGDAWWMCLVASVREEREKMLVGRKRRVSC